MSPRSLVRWGGLVITLVVMLAGVVRESSASVRDEEPALQAAFAQTILSEPDIIRGWTIGGGFIYWYESCNPFVDETVAFLKRRAVNGTIVHTLANINDAEACETLIGPAVDDSGFYYYNRSSGTIEAFYSDATAGSFTVLATVGKRDDLGFGIHTISGMFLDETHVYWIEVDTHGEFEPSDVRIRRVSKSGGAPETVLAYQGGGAGHGMVMTDDFIWWTDGQGVQRLHKPPCSNSPDCAKTLIHSTVTFKGRLAINDADDILWWDAEPVGGQDPQIWVIRCQAGLNCQTALRYTPPTFSRILGLVVDDEHLYWAEVFNSGTSSVRRLRRLAVVGGSAETIFEDDLGVSGLALDDQGVYFQSRDQKKILRLPLNAGAIQREISLAGWEVTQAIQSAVNDVPLVAGKETFVRVYPQLDSGVSSAGVQALLHGSRDGVPLPGSPLVALNGNRAVLPGSVLARRGSLNSGWLFRLPDSWTKDTPDDIPLEDANLTLRVVLDPLNATGDTTPGNNSAEQTFTFVAKAPTCVNLRSVITTAPYQSPWDGSVAGVFELANAAHPTPYFLRFYEFNPLRESEGCWKSGFYGPFCLGPYELIDDDSRLLTEIGLLDLFTDSPAFCTATGARTLFAGIVSAEAPWDSNGLARIGGDGLITRVPREGTWSWPLGRTVNSATTFLHEVGHNYNRRHVDCAPVGDDRPKNPDTNYPYNTSTLDDGPLDAATTHFGFDSRSLAPLPPDTNMDYLSYCHPRWASDYTWKAIFNNTRHAGPRLTFALASADTADAYTLVSGVITATVPSGALSPAWNYPTAEASDSLVQKWEELVAAQWPSAEDPTPYHVRVLGGGGVVLTDRAIPLVELSEGAEGIYPFNVVYPTPGDRVQAIQLMVNGTVLATFRPGAATPEVTILAPEGGVTGQNGVTLQWSATDADEEPWLSYTVQYSPDRGASWHSLIADQPGPGRGIVESVSLDLSGQPGSDGENALLRVLASDGYNTGIATSEPFTVASRAPDVMITAPEEGQWIAADAPVQLRGDAFDPEDGHMNDNVFGWSLSDLAIDGRTAIVQGLAPGAHTATLRATDSDGQRDSAQVTFHVAPLDVPLASDPALDGKCDDPAYAEAGLPLSPYADGSRADAAVVRTSDHLWVCLQGLQGDSGFAGLTVDVDNSRDGAVQAGDRGFFIRTDGTLVSLEGDAGSFVPVHPDGMAAHISVQGATWNAELRVAADALGGWNRRVALSVGHHLDEASAAWPRTTALENPHSWAQTNLGAGERLALTAISPESAVLGSRVTLNVTGTGFRTDTAVLWDGAAVATTFVDSRRLEATVDAGLVNDAGLHLVQVAPGDAPLLGSLPLSFLVNNPQPTLNALTPSSAPMEGDGFTLTVHGAAFVDGATVLWNGEARPTRFVSPTRLEAEISADDLAAARPVAVTVANPDPNAGVSDAAVFTVVSEAFQLYLPHVQRN